MFKCKNQIQHLNLGEEFDVPLFGFALMCVLGLQIEYLLVIAAGLAGWSAIN